MTREEMKIIEKMLKVTPVSPAQNDINRAKTVNVILVPEGATNGDIILAAFPEARYHVFESLKSVNVVTDDTHKAQIFNLDWWNALYRPEEGKNI